MRSHGPMGRTALSEDICSIRKRYSIVYQVAAFTAEMQYPKFLFLIEWITSLWNGIAFPTYLELASKVQIHLSGLGLFASFRVQSLVPFLHLLVKSQHRYLHLHPHHLILEIPAVSSFHLITYSFDFQLHHSGHRDSPQLHSCSARSLDKILACTPHQILLTVHLLISSTMFWEAGS